MALWKEIKKAVNNTIGTRQFKPLDQILVDNTKIKVTFVATSVGYGANDELVGTTYIKNVKLNDDIDISKSVILFANNVISGVESSYISAYSISLYENSSGKFARFSLSLNSNVGIPPVMLTAQIVTFGSQLEAGE